MHSKSRNRLGNKKVTKLAYVYINSRAIGQVQGPDIVKAWLGEDEDSGLDSDDGGFPLLEDLTLESEDGENEGEESE